MQRNRIVENNPGFGYLPAIDRMYSKRPEPSLRFNIIGAGLNGREHFRVTEFEGRAAVHGVYDPNPGSIELIGAEAAQAFPGKRLLVYGSLEEACRDPAADALIIATPNYTHIDVIKTAIAFGKHVFLEKPMATTLRDAWEILRLAEGYPKVFQIGLQYRYKAIFSETIHEALERESVGRLRHISISEHRIPFLDKVGQWNKFSALSGGTFVEKCCHYFDLFNLFAASKPVKVYASGGRDVNFLDFEREGRASDILDNGFAIVEYANGVRACLDLCMFAPLFYEEVVLCGSQGRIKASEKMDFSKGEASDCLMEVNAGEERPIRISHPQFPRHVEMTGHDGATFIEHIKFVDAILGARGNAATVEEGFWAVAVGCAAELSAGSGVPVFIDEMLRREGIVA